MLIEASSNELSEPRDLLGGAMGRSERVLNIKQDVFFAYNLLHNNVLFERPFKQLAQARFVGSRMDFPGLGIRMNFASFQAPG